MGQYVARISHAAGKLIKSNTDDDVHKSTLPDVKGRLILSAQASVERSAPLTVLFAS